MGTEKRERQKANRQARLEAEETAASRRRRNRLILRIGAVVVVALVGFFVYSLLTGDDGEDTVEAAASTTAAGPSTTAGPGTASSTTPGGSTATSGATATSDGGAASTTAPGATPTTVPGVATTAVATTLPPPVTPECPAEDGSSERQLQFTEAPPTCIDPAAAYTAEVVTSEGSFTIALDSEADEAAVNNFVFLARYHYFDGLDFHRVVPAFVIQGGDPSGDGSGGPGYTWTGSRPESSDVYAPGSVSMANSGGDPATNGSQFFIALDDLSDRLTADYTYFGEVVEGFEVVEAIGALGEGDGPPSRPVLIESVTITQT